MYKKKKQLKLRKQIESNNEFPILLKEEAAFFCLRKKNGSSG